MAPGLSQQQCICWLADLHAGGQRSLVVREHPVGAAHVVDNAQRHIVPPEDGEKRQHAKRRLQVQPATHEATFRATARKSLLLPDIGAENIVSLHKKHQLNTM